MYRDPVVSGILIIGCDFFFFFPDNIQQCIIHPDVERMECSRGSLSGGGVARRKISKEHTEHPSLSSNLFSSNGCHTWNIIVSSRRLQILILRSLISSFDVRYSFAASQQHQPSLPPLHRVINSFTANATITPQYTKHYLTR